MHYGTRTIVIGVRYDYTCWFVYKRDVREEFDSFLSFVNKAS